MEDILDEDDDGSGVLVKMIKTMMKMIMRMSGKC